MISTPDRVKAVELIDEAVVSGARRSVACKEMGISDRTYRRWTHDGKVRSDGRPEAERAAPTNKLSDAERQEILDVCHTSEHADKPPGQIVPTLADNGLYLGSESTYYRVLRENDEQHHRGRAKVPTPGRTPTSHCATAANQVWTWDVSYLPTLIRGQFYYLYAILDIYSRKITGWEVHDCEDGDHAAALVHRAVISEGCPSDTLVLHADNGSIQKGSTLRAKLEFLGVSSSFSRPRVSNDNPYSESLFRTCKYCPSYPSEGFASLEAARAWIKKFVYWYNNEHKHSGIKHVTPAQRHAGEDIELLAHRRKVYEAARKRNPNRWSGSTRNWDHISEVWLNPEKPSVKAQRSESMAA